MGAPAPDMNPADEASAEALLSSLRTIGPAERRKHAIVYNYWLSIRGNRQFPPIRDLDPLEISDAGPTSVLLEMIGGGEDAEIRHIGQDIKGGISAEKVSEAPNPSLLACIAARLQLVAACREGIAFEDEFETADGKTRCWVTLLPFSATGTWIDYVYGFVSLDSGSAAAEVIPEPTAETEPTGDLSEVLQLADSLAEADNTSSPEIVEESVEALDAAPEPEEAAVEAVEDEIADEPISEAVEEAPKPGFSAKLFEKLANAGGFYGRSVEMDMDAFEVVPPEQSEQAAEPEADMIEPEPEIAPEPEAELAPEPRLEPETEIAPEPEAEEDIEVAAETAEPSPPKAEGDLHNKLTEVRAKADEARQAKLRANAALYEGLSAAYDFALDAEDAPEEYLKLVEAQGLKIQLRSPMKPVAKLAFDEMCDDATIKQLEAVLSWAFQEELPRGTLADRIEAAGGIGAILHAKAA